MADTHETLGQHVQQEATHEFFGAYRHDLEPMMVGIILPAETHLSVFHGHQPGVGDGHAMRVAPQVAKNVLGSGERPLGKDHPLLLVQPIQQVGKNAPVGQCRNTAAQVQAFAPVEFLQSCQELTLEQFRQGLDRQQIVRPRGQPAAAIGRQAPAGDDAMQVRMEQQVLSPGVQDRRDTKLGAQAFRISSQLQQSLGGGPE